jgi:hypothetical protein
MGKAADQALAIKESDFFKGFKLLTFSRIAQQLPTLRTRFD